MAAITDVTLQKQILQDYTIVATRNGIVESLPYHVGDRVMTNTTVAVITTNTMPYARIYVPEPYRVNIKAGSILTIHVDGIQKALSRHCSLDSNSAFFHALLHPQW